MNFASDNIMGASQKVLDAIAAANSGALASYGGDPITKRLEQTFRDLFETECSTFLVTTGTAANALAISAMTPPYAACLTHEEAHAIDDECGAPEFFGSGCKLVGVPGAGAKLTAAAIHHCVDNEPGGTNHPPLRGLSLSQATECGMVHTLDEIRAVTEAARQHGLHVHMDGARFANALVALGCTPAEMTWKAGVDCLSFGGTKNGCLMAEAVVFFKPDLAHDFIYRRKRAGQTVSKGRLLAAQFEAYFDGDHWLSLARHANAMARALSDGLAAIPGLRRAWPTEANEVFIILPRAQADAMRAAGANFYEWTDKSLPAGERVGETETLVRLIASFATSPEQVARLLDLARSTTVQAK